MNVLIRMPVLSMQADAYFIKNPNEITNTHTITSAQDAADVLSLTGESSIDELKGLIRGCDFTSISTNELVTVGLRLYELDLIDKHVFGAFISGNMAFDKFGHQTERNVKFNSIAMFNQMLDDNKVYARAWPIYAQQESFKFVTRELLAVNQVVNALAYFANSAENDLSVNLKV